MSADGDDDSFGGYGLGETLLSFGTIVVRRATRIRDDLPVRLQMLRPGLHHASWTEHLLPREHRIVRQVDHPAIPPVLERVRDGDEIALAYPDHGGHTLQAVVSKRPLAPLAAAAVGVAVASALTALHASGHPHGLLRAELVELTPSGHVFLHGVGQLRRGGDRGRDELLEVPRHMAPEMILGDEATEASDIFLVGMLLFFAMTGSHPFAGDEAGISQRIRHASTPSLRQRVPTVPRDLARIVVRCLEKRAIDRYADALALHAALDAVLRRHARKPRETLVAAALAEARLGREPASPRERHLRAPSPTSPRYVIPGLVALATAGALVVVGFTLDRCASGDAAGPADPRGVVGRPAQLRIVAHPWAEVWIDGELRDTTPIGLPVEVPPGRHEVVFRHPNAKDEVRVVEVIPGQTVLLDIEMQVVRPAPSAQAQGGMSPEEASP